jgi:hypothetical protein
MEDVDHFNVNLGVLKLPSIMKEMGNLDVNLEITLVLFMAKARYCFGNNTDRLLIIIILLI